MEYSQKFTLPSSEIEGELLINYSSHYSDTDQEISGSISFDSPSTGSNQTLEITAKHGAIVSPALIETEGGEQSESLRFRLPPDVSRLSIGIALSDTGKNAAEGCRIEFDDLTLLSLGNELFREDTFNAAEFKRQVTHYMDSSGNIWPLVNFTGELARFTDFDKYVEAVMRLVEEYPNINQKSDTIIETLLKRTLIGDIGDGRHHMQGLSEFESAVEKLSNIHKSANPNPNKSIDYSLKQLDKNEQLEELLRVINELNVVDTHPEVLDDKLIYTVIAEEVQRRSESGVRNIIEQCISTTDSGEFDAERYDKIKSGAMEVSDSEKALSRWYALLEYAGTRPESSELRFIIANLLNEVADENRGNSEFYYLTPHLYRAAGVWYSDENERAQRCFYEYNFRHGLYLYHNLDFEDSVSYFSSAIEIAANDKEEYEQPYPGWLDFPIIYKSLAEARQLTKEGQRRQAAELLKERREILSNLKSVSDDSRQRIVSAVGGERLRILSDIHLEEGEYERANKALGRAIGLFKQVDLERSARNSINKRREVKAVLNEVKGNFDTAADVHQSIAEDDSYSSGKKSIHGIRAKVCKAKVETKKWNFDTAVEILKEINRSTDELKGDARDLGILLRLLDSYSDGDVRSATQALKKLSRKTGGSLTEHPLNVEYDYTEPIVVVLAVQRLRQTQLPQDLLQSILEITVRRALTPDYGDSNVDDTYLTDISIERLWRERLPSIVLNRVEEIQLDSATITGNRKGVTLLLSELLEIYLALLVEYHGKSYWGDNWRNELTNEDENEEKLSIGVLARIFNSEAGEEIDNSETLYDTYFDSTNRFDNMTAMRNQFDHAYEGYVDKDEFQDLREWVFDFLRYSVQDAPLIGSVEDKNQFNIYSVRLHWWRGFRQIILDTDAELEQDSYYYFPADAILESDSRVVQSVSEDEIIAVDDGRVTDQLDELYTGQS